MKFLTRNVAAVSLVLLFVGCASLAERDQPEDVRNTLRRDALDCGTDTACLKKREAARDRVTPPTP